MCGIWVEMSMWVLDNSGCDQFCVILVLGFLKRAMLWIFVLGVFGV